MNRNELLLKMRGDAVTKLLNFARAVEPFVADAACRKLFGHEKSREIYNECEKIRPLIWAAEAGEKDAEADLGRQSP